MNREDIIRMANEAHGSITAQWWDMDVASLERFAVLVAQQEREACAKMCDYLWEDDYSAYACAEAIRARENRSE